VLPALGEHSVQTATVAVLAAAGLGGTGAGGLGPGGGGGVTDLADEAEPEVARLKSTIGMVEAIEAAVRFYEQPPEESWLVQTEWVDLRLARADWAEAFASVEDGTPHNEAHTQIHQTLVEILMDKAGDDVPAEHLR